MNDRTPQVQHYRILRNGDGKYLLWVVQFNSINEYQLRRVTALHNFQPSEPGEIGFDANDEILVLDDADENWWRGRTTRDENFNIGIFPSNFVRPNDNFCQQNVN